MFTVAVTRKGDSEVYFDALWELILGSGEMPHGFQGSMILVFAAGSATWGLLAVLLDRLLFSVRNRSVLGLSWGESYEQTIKFMIVWGLGAGLGGFLGASTDIFQYTRGACFTVGVGWPVIIPRLVESVYEQIQNVEEQQSPVEEQQSPEEN